MNSGKKICLIGNPNCGKSTLFHKLTGIYQKIANYPGVTTEKKIGKLKIDNLEHTLVDLPGCYSLYPNSIDEAVVLQEILYENFDLAIFILDASQLNRSLLLLSQLIDLKVPIVVALNMLDQLEITQNLEIETPFLSKELGLPILEINAKKGYGLNEIKKQISTTHTSETEVFFADKNLFSQYIDSSNFSYRQWLQFTKDSQKNAITENIKKNDIISRYNQIEEIVKLTTRKTKKAFERIQFTEKLDKYLLNPFWGIVFLLMILYIVFQTLFTIASFPMEWLDSFFGWASSIVNSLNIHETWKSFFADAVIPGIGGVLIFIPQIALLFIINTILEESGYLSRIVFLLDHWMRKIGMSGKSLLPLMSGNACAIPAIASTKSIPTHKERIITILCIPLMTCSARLPVYTLLISIIIPLKFQGLALLSMYMIGILSTVVVGWISNKIIKTQENSFLIMDLPTYKIPTFRNILMNVKNAVIPFIKTAGKFIFTISIILWFFASFKINSDYSISKTTIENSTIASVGKSIEPVITPLGYDWKIGISLLTSFSAREVFVSTLATLYNIDSEDESSLIESIQSQVNPVTNQPVITFASGISLLIFYAFALQCMSTLASMRQETDSWYYPVISFVALLLIAYFGAFSAYQLLS